MKENICKTCGHRVWYCPFSDYFYHYIWDGTIHDENHPNYGKSDTGICWCGCKKVKIGLKRISFKR